MFESFMNQSILVRLRANIITAHIACFIFFLLFGFALFVSSKSLLYDFYSDDIHLIRTYTLPELQSVFSGEWDPDHLETSGYRPFTTLFNHTRAVIFGENTLYHRLFILMLLALSLTLFCKILFDYYAVPYLYSTLGCILTISARYNWFNLVWISDGIHVFILFLFVLSLWGMTVYLNKGKWLALATCLGLIGTAFFTREDALILATLLPVFGAYYIFILQRLSPGNNLHRNQYRFGQMVALLGLLLMISVFLHFLFVPRTNILDIAGWVTHISWSIFPMGSFLYTPWIIVLIITAIATVTILPKEKRYTVFFWALCLVVAAAPGIVRQRINLLLLPILFFSQLLAFVFLEITKRNSILKLLIILLLGSAILLSTRLNMTAQETMNPLSIERIVNTNKLLGKATIPAKRLIRLENEETKLGIITKQDIQRLNYLLKYSYNYGTIPQTYLPPGLFIPPILFYEL
jgi:hypothetical protein